ncbi:MAG: succinate dehydrogenase, hydrophobic membrane anchor protein, partial [Alphaproteobacteria bacterium]|nr:succinate dehydrogenase, hydrophobic membrane anchor protein [Alphaproteobacteria bacterium]
MKDPHTLQTPLARARGLGASHHGSLHWMQERLTSLASIPLTLWLACSILYLKDASHSVIAAWLGHPLNAIMMLLFIFTIFYHTLLGLQVITEDYI